MVWGNLRKTRYFIRSSTVPLAIKNLRQKTRCYYYYLILYCRRGTLQSRTSLFQSGGLGTYHISNILWQIFLDVSINTKKLRFLELRPPPPPLGSLIRLWSKILCQTPFNMDRTYMCMKLSLRNVMYRIQIVLRCHL